MKPNQFKFWQKRSAEERTALLAQIPPDPNYSVENIHELAVQYLWEIKSFKEKMRVLKEQMELLVKEKHHIKNDLMDNPIDGWLWEMIFDNITEEQVQIEKEIKLLEWEKNPKGEGINIEQARAVPINTLLQFNRAKFAKCLWHEDHHPSLFFSQKRNKVHCFSCGVDHDSIDVVMQLQSCDLKSAVKFLTNT